MTARHYDSLPIELTFSWADAPDLAFEVELQYHASHCLAEPDVGIAHAYVELDDVHTDDGVKFLKVFDWWNRYIANEFIDLPGEADCEFTARIGARDIPLTLPVVVNELGEIVSIDIAQLFDGNVDIDEAINDEEAAVADDRARHLYYDVDDYRI